MVNCNSLFELSLPNIPLYACFFQSAPSDLRFIVVTVSRSFGFVGFVFVRFADDGIMTILESASARVVLWARIHDVIFNSMANGLDDREAPPPYVYVFDMYS